MGGKSKVMQADGWKGGNTTFGKDRRGYRGGRKSVHPPGTLTWPLMARLTDQEYAIAVMIGEGNLSLGVRRAMAYFDKMIKRPEGIDSRFAMVDYVEANRAALRRTLAPIFGLPAEFQRSGSQRLAHSVGAPQEGWNADPLPRADWDDAP